MQKQHWEPLFAWVKDTYSVELAVAEGFTPAKQSQETHDRLKGVVQGMDIWELAGMSLP